MAITEVTSVKNPAFVRRVPSKLADALVSTGKFAYTAVAPAAPKPVAVEVPVSVPSHEEPAENTERRYRARTDGKPPETDFDSMSYAELRDLVNERELSADGRTKAAYIAALRYNTRAMDAG